MAEEQPEQAGRDDELGDPQEHPEQHAALQTQKQSEAAPEEGSENTTFDTEEHSAADGPFGTG
jgi:hypothetical protein